MKTKTEARAELLEALGIDAILQALHLYCSGSNCNDCQYINKDGTCQAIEKFFALGEFVAPSEIPFGSSMEDDDEDF